MSAVAGKCSSARSDEYVP